MKRILNPTKYIRKAFIDALPQYKVFDTSVPIDEDYPHTYVTIDNMNLTWTEVTKSCHEFFVDLTLNIWQVQEKGFVSSVSVEDIEEDIMNAQLDAEPFRIKDRKLIESKPMNVGNVTRRVIIERIWVDAELLDIIINAMPYDADKENTIVI